MEQRKGVTLNGISGLNFLYIFNALFMIGVSIYLTTHFYDVLYPTKLGGASTLCNISSFFNCDGATYSKAAHVAGVPTGFFGIMMGLFLLLSACMPSVNMEKTASAISKYNFIGCVVLFFYSLLVLGSLCPFCTAYYVLSGIAAFLLWKFGIDSWVPDTKILGIAAVVGLAGAGVMHQTTAGKEDMKSKLNSSIVSQFRKLPVIAEAPDSPYKIHMATEKFSEAPIRISVFSDFECPFCKVVADQMPELIRRYPKQINIQYFFYPLDAKCNSNVKSAFHAHACDAAKLAACDEKKFLEVHDDIFLHQDKLKEGILQELEKKHNLPGCIENDENKNKVITLINAATQFNLKSTPTIIVNGKKIEGTIPSGQFFAIFDDILSEQK
jgi:uncharacterized membrane protein